MNWLKRRRERKLVDHLTWIDAERKALHQRLRDLDHTEEVVTSKLKELHKDALFSGIKGRRA